MNPNSSATTTLHEAPRLRTGTQVGAHGFATHGNFQQVARLPNGLMPLLTKSLQPHDLDNHRAAVCLIMETMVRKHDKFGWDQMNAGMRKMIREDWLAALADYPVGEVRTACRKHTQELPNKVPNEGHILSQIINARRVFLASQPKPIEPAAAPRVVGDAQKAEAAELVRGFAVRGRV